MKKKVLITGGAGFIGSHLTDELLRAGCEVRILDNLCPQVHGPMRKIPAYLSKEAEFVLGDVNDRQAVLECLRGVSAVFHFAAAVGVGQSMYEIAHYTTVNNLGTASLLEALSQRPVERLVVASSMSIYGEGLYHDSEGCPCQDVSRRPADLHAGQWEPLDWRQKPLIPVATPESKMPVLGSVYALSKYDQERLCLLIGQAYGIETTALRFFNTYGPRQALSNPYTGVLAIFASRYLNNKPPLIFEDGMQRRDFVSVYDVARACRLTLESPMAAGQVLNIGSGRSFTVLEVAQKMAEVMNRPEIRPTVCGKYRVGDIRHCFADIRLARRILGYNPEYTLEQGIEDLGQWLTNQAAEDHVDKAREELERRGLAI